MSPNFLIYGANGYTGRLITHEAVALGLRPVVAGRSAEAIAPIAEALGLERRIFSLDSAAGLDEGLHGMTAVIHCSGPFSRTSAPMVAACLRNRVHYVDITGEISVFEAAAARDAEARERGVMLLPGAGFDVVPSDCLAVHLKQKLPAATRLTLAFRGGKHLSRGTATTVVENLPNGTFIRENGALRTAADEQREVDFGNGPTRVQLISWGDVATAYYSTGIPNIKVYTPVPKALQTLLPLARAFRPVIASGPVQRFLKGRIQAGPPGPTDEQRARDFSQLWGEVSDEQGNRVEARLAGPEGYTVTMLTALIIVQRILAGNAPVGFQTPAKAYGPELVLEVPGVTRTP